MSKRAVVTGASGHLGFHIARAALQAGFEVELLVRRRNTNVDRLMAAGAHFTIVDFTDRATFRSHLQWADVLFQVAAASTAQTPSAAAMLAGTAGLTEQILNAAVAEGVPRIVYTSSAAVLGSSQDAHRLLQETDRTLSSSEPATQGKILADQVCDRLIRDHGADVRRIYPSFMAGPADPRGTPLHRLIRHFLKHGQRFRLTGGISVAAVEEVARAHVAAALAAERCASYVLGGENITLPLFYEVLASLSGRAVPSVYVPTPVLLSGWKALDSTRVLAGKRPAGHSAALRTLVGQFRWYDSSKAVLDLNYKIPPVKEVLAAGILMERKRAAGTNVLFPRSSNRQTLPTVSVEVQAPPILLTGAPGWLGNRLIDILLNGDRTGFRHPPRQVHLLVHPRHQGLFDLPENFRIFPADLRRHQSLAQAFAGVQSVFHLAEATHSSRSASLFEANTQSTRHLADECMRAGVRRFLYLSSAAVCGSGIFEDTAPPNPWNDYGKSKSLAEEYILQKTNEGLLDGTILRGFWYFGPFAPARQERFLASLKRTRQLVFGGGKNIRSVTHIDNMVAAFLAAERKPESIGKAYWIGDHKADYTTDEIYQALCTAAGQPYRPLYVPPVACSAARAAQGSLTRWGLQSISLHDLGRQDLDSSGRIDAAQRDFGYQPVISFPEYAQELARRGKLPLTSKRASAG